MSNNNSNNSTIERQYPMLQSCRVTIRNENYNKDRPPIRLPTEIMDTYTNIHTKRSTLPKPYDFSLEHDVLCKKADRDGSYNMLSSLVEGSSISASSLSTTDNSVNDRTLLQKNIITRMKSVTNGSDDVCISLLEKNSYDLNTSVEAFLQSNNSN